MKNARSVCSGDERQFVCAMCGRPPGERCPKFEVPTRRCPGCEGTGRWPMGSLKTCIHCRGTGRLKTTNQKGAR